MAETAISAAETVVSAAETVVSAAETVVSAAETGVSAAETAVSAAKTVVSAARTAVSDSERVRKRTGTKKSVRATLRYQCGHQDSFFARQLGTASVCNFGRCRQSF